MFRRVFVAVLALAVAALPAAADWPFLTEDAELEPPGHYSVDFGVGYRDGARDFAVVDRNWQWEIGRVRADFGLGERVEVQARGTALLVFEQVPTSRPPQPHRASNWGDWVLGTKVRLLEAGPKRPALAVLWEVKLPIASNDRGAGTDETDFYLHLNATRRLGERDRLDGQLGLGLLGDPRQRGSQSDVLVARVAWARELSANRLVGAEAVSQLGPADTIDPVSVRGVWEEGVGPWRLHAALAVGVTHDADDFSVTLGARRRFRF